METISRVWTRWTAHSSEAATFRPKQATRFCLSVETLLKMTTVELQFQPSNQTSICNPSAVFVSVTSVLQVGGAQLFGSTQLSQESNQTNCADICDLMTTKMAQHFSRHMNRKSAASGALKQRLTASHLTLPPLDGQKKRTYRDGQRARHHKQQQQQQGSS